MFIDTCKFVEQYEPEHVYVVTGNCIFTKKEYTVVVPAQGLFNYRNGMNVQQAFPNMSPDDREFIMSGISPAGWDDTFNTDEPDE